MGACDVDDVEMNAGKEEVTENVLSDDFCLTRCRAYIFPVAIIFPIDVSAHAR